MIIEKMSLGIYGANCYIVAPKENCQAIVVDPGGDALEIVNKLEELNLTLKYIVLTHGHGDHIGGLKVLKEKTNAKVLIHKNDEVMLLDADINLSSKMSMENVEVSPDELLKDGDKLNIDDLIIEIIHTPGHTQGSICLKFENHIITGDTLFAGSIGRTDLYGGSFEDILESIKNKLMIYDDEILVLPGHGPFSKIGLERSKNPFINK